MNSAKGEDDPTKDQEGSNGKESERGAQQESKTVVLQEELGGERQNSPQAGPSGFGNRFMTGVDLDLITIIQNAIGDDTMKEQVVQKYKETAGIRIDSPGGQGEVVDCIDLVSDDEAID